MSPFSPLSRLLSTQSATDASQRSRSASVRGCPACIFSIFDGGCSASPSSNDQPSSPAKMRATVDFPQPDTPIKTSTTGFLNGQSKSANHGSWSGGELLGVASPPWPPSPRTARRLSPRSHPGLQDPEHHARDGGDSVTSNAA